ncbi:MAG TPA: nitroreductase family deazaflavin-dependent oxidoreductase [Solirubrobacterales bacterium]|nr:nitroreductase family deazaflavin-dependent oxidoreductase [Solirubrobacterales bacterium]
MKLPPAPQAQSRFWWFWERFTDFHALVYKASRGRIGGTAYGAPIALVESVGRTSGKRRTHPLICRPDGENLVLVASKGGIDRHPAWYLNLRANPETTAWWKGRQRRVRARDATDAERERLWKMMVEIYRPYESYQRRTERKIPVVVLEPA